MLSRRRMGGGEGAPGGESVREKERPRKRQKGPVEETVEEKGGEREPSPTGHRGRGGCSEVTTNNNNKTE